MISTQSEEHRRILPIHEGWQLARTRASAFSDPANLAIAAGDWRPALVPGTVATSVHTDINAAGNYDAEDWWYRAKFSVADQKAATHHRMVFEGLATLAEVWLNGTKVLTSRNMFMAHKADVSRLLLPENEIVICFRSLQAAMAGRRPRPRWKTRLVDQQNLRWFRTTLLGRIPGWTPAITPVGPWRPIYLESAETIELVSLNLQTRAERTTGHVEINAVLAMTDRNQLDGARFRLGDHVHELDIVRSDQLIAKGKFAVADIPLWWPHTHGVPQLVPWALEVQVAGQWLLLEKDVVGFKAIELDQSGGGVRFNVNEIPVFCRGACWTAMDICGLGAQPEALRTALKMARNAGANMLRVSGTMVYESTDFYKLCDELGILVWQDFMFANMDYPVADPQFGREIVAEVEQQLNRLQRRVCLATYCGGSEIAQQAAMLGLPAAEWTNDFFSQQLPGLCTALHPGIPYFPSTPWGGALPFHVGTGISHYYGVGAYRRPLLDARLANVKFTSECLGFSNVPEAGNMALIMNGATLPPHHPRWKARVPRDSGAGWDFEDIRDYYVKLLFNVDPVELRSSDLARYFALSSVVTGEIMQRVFSEWRSSASDCGGALVWFYRDLWPGAGWGITDSCGGPKAAWWYLKRAWACRAIRITDNGLDGLDVHIINESAEVLNATVELDMLHYGRIATSATQVHVNVAPWETLTLHGDAMLGYFTDSTSAYRFGPPKFDVVVTRLIDRSTAQPLSEDFHFPSGMNLPVQQEAKVDANAVWHQDGTLTVTLVSEVFLQAVSIAGNGLPDDNYFHLPPGLEKKIVFSGMDVSATAFRVYFSALNLASTVTARAERHTSEGPSSMVK